MKTNKRKVIPWIAIGALVLIGTTVWLSTRNSASVYSAGAAASQAEVVPGDIQTTVVGTGNIAYGDTVDIHVPAGLKYDEILVEAGDTLAVGDIIAQVNPLSIQTRIQEVQKEIASIDSQIHKEKDADSETSLTASVEGRVKAIYVEKDDKVLTTMLEKGALALLSIDGKMAVDVPDAALQIGEEVDVILENGARKTGTVEKASAGTAVITLTDNGPALHEPVTVELDGAVIGTGALYIHQPISVIAHSGTVKTVHVSENDKVAKGKKLFTLKDTEISADYQQLLDRRNDLTDTLATLMLLSQTGVIQADQDGVVDSVFISDSNKSSQTTANPSANGAASPYSQMSAGLQYPGYTPLAAQASGLTLTPLSAGTLTDIQALPNLHVAPPQTGAAPQSALAADKSYGGRIVWSPADPVFMPDTAYSVKITLTANTGYRFPSWFAPVLEGTSQLSFELDSILERNQLTITAVYPKTEALEPTAQPEKEGTPSTPVPSDPNANPGATAPEVPTGIAPTDENSTLPEATGSLPNMSGSGSQQGLGSSASGMPSGSSSGMSLPSGYGSQSASSLSGYSLPATGSSSTSAMSSASGSTGSSAATGSSIDDDLEISALTVVPVDTMRLSIQVDELDILSVELGQETAIVFDAMEDRTFSGVISKINHTANATNGVAKYTVEITLPYDAAMRSGMNATATISIEERTGVLTLPVDALQERSGRVYVYTTFDPETGDLGGEQDITTGLSDGTLVEITQGLAQGDTVYYVLKGSQSLEQLMGGFGMPGMGSGRSGGSGTSRQRQGGE